MLLAGFLLTAALLWLSVFGYVAALLGVAARRRRPGTPTVPAAGLPRIVVVVPVRNEARFIADKLADVRRADYPQARLRIVVVDGGSTDATRATVEQARAGDAALELVRVDGAAGKADQLNAVLGGLGEEIIVVTDADARLAPDCIRALVDLLRADPSTAMVGARVCPATRLLEERIHWWLLNSLWWLEGEAFGAAALSGVCYAIRPSAVSLLPSDCSAEDVRFALVANQRGLRVRICRRALATELRVPQTAHEFLHFRRRRGSGYVRELRRLRSAPAPLGCRVVRHVRLFHLCILPALLAGLIATGVALAWTPHWHWASAVLIAFALPSLAALAASTTLGGDRRRWWELGVAAGRLAGLTWLSLLALPRPMAPPPLIRGD